MSLSITNTAIANWYLDPDFTSPVVTQSLFGETVRILEEKGNWLRVQGTDAYIGWMQRSQAVVTEKVYPADYFVLDFYGVIESPSGGPVKPITYGSRLYGRENGSVLNVTLPDGNPGEYRGLWTRQTLEPTPENLVRTARSFLGVPYIWGGRSPWGFDCSGLIQTIFSRCGILFPRDANLQKEIFPPSVIEPENAVTGDLYFFSQDEKISHVGLALGNGKILHAKGWVKIESLNAAASDANPDLIQRLSAICSTRQLRTESQLESTP